MSNPKIETDVVEILKDLQSGQKEILREISEIKTDVAVLKTNQESIKEQLLRIDGTQTKQIWALIIAVFGIVGVLAIAFFNLRSRI